MRSAPWLVALAIASGGLPSAFGDPDPRKTLGEVPADCRDVECMVTAAYRKDAKARDLALALWRETGWLAGIGDDEVMDGGYRGKIHLVPQWPIGGYRQHLQWVTDAARAIDGFFVQLYAKHTTKPNYRWKSIAVRFVRSVGKRTPSAYAAGWAVTYNVEGTLLTTSAGVLETLFHELFHSNDGAHKDWSARVLQHDYDAIVAKCPGVKIKCLAPYAPNDTTVRGGTYYAFQPNNGNGVHEYAAELAVRYWEEQRAMLAHGKLATKPFKCGPPENGRAWQALVDEFFAGVDLTPKC